MSECRKARRRVPAFDCKLGSGHEGNCSPYTLPPMRPVRMIGCEPAPLCPRNPEHGRLEYRAPGTPEQAFTHIAYRCPAGYPSYCSGSADWPAPQLIAWFDEQGHHEHAAQLRKAWEPA